MLESALSAREHARTLEPSNASNCLSNRPISLRDNAYPEVEAWPVIGESIGSLACQRHAIEIPRGEGRDESQCDPPRGKGQWSVEGRKSEPLQGRRSVFYSRTNFASG